MPARSGASRESWPRLHRQHSRPRRVVPHGAGEVHGRRSVFEGVLQRGARAARVHPCRTNPAARGTGDEDAAFVGAGEGGCEIEAGPGEGDSRPGTIVPALAGD